jgi:hypothetical protein
MGYILPIHPEQYTQYANRTIPVKHQYQKLAKVIGPKIEADLENPDQPFEFAQAKERRTDKVAAKKKIYAREKVEEIFGQITGKGRLINEVI